ncbi:single-stranded-DNA-specific exonuclease RecJ [Liquorilactobacillus hordei]|uniref:single-stranded-DNA-specific exonuclease RecJ n=1 Tax=Liquorilactobacillus hordei TaxID=468911 RepID=UPI00070B7765|nr:single-stranded-DNA-specific exonuclease RecJ [Liquorilactobacillus hordei]QYH52713.1 single-stranded-DNA-specific exonuclease RecJ [Liquorilactobacillus hordei DSM 19519]
MFDKHYEWKFESTALEEKELKLQKQMGISKLLARLLVKRNISNSDAANKFLNPSEDNICDPYLLHDMDKAVERIQNAVMNNQMITVYGDYDADGLTSTAVMYETLEQLGASVNYYIPDRFVDGYGPNIDVYKKLISAGTELIITVDNGVSGYEEVAYAQSKGVDVVITDHHELPDKLPEAAAIVHPRHPNKKYPCPDLAGVGVAFKVASALLEDIPQELLDLVAIGTVADLMPLLGENRALVKFGIIALRNTQRLGLLTLLDNAKINVADISEETIGFALAPRLNSLGRIQNGNTGVELLTTLDDDRAKQLADKVEELNAKRKELVTTITEQALQKLAEENPNKHLINVVAGENWHEGVLGIVASHLVERTGKPSLVLSVSEDGETVKGSGRSIESFQLFDAINVHRDLLISFGGHHMACGLALEKSKVVELQRVLDVEAKNQQLDLDKKTPLEVEQTIEIDDLSLDFFEEIKQLAPFGVANPKPIFSFSNYKVQKSILMGQDKNHFKMTLKGRQEAIDAIAFSIGENGQQLVNNADEIEFVGELSTNVWRGQTKLQIMIKDFCLDIAETTKIRVNDLRHSKLTPNLLRTDGEFFFFDATVYRKLANYFKRDARIIVGLDKLPEQAKVNNLIIVDCPPNLESFSTLLNKVEFEEITTILYPYKPILLTGMPTKEELGKVYRFAVSHKNIDLKNDLNKLADYLKIKKDLLIFMLQVFFEVGFVKIDNGLMAGSSSSRRINLKDAPSYRARQRLLEAENVLLTSKTVEFEKIISQFITV